MLQAGRYGATKQTWRDKTVRELFTEIKTANPQASEGVLRRLFLDAARRDDDFFEAVVDYAFDNALRAYNLGQEQRSKRAPVTAERRAEKAAAIAHEAAQHAKAVASVKEKIILLNQEMPNGQRARYCTLDYFWRLGGAYRAIGKKGSRRLVGQEYSEEKYREKLGSLTD